MSRARAATGVLLAASVLLAAGCGGDDKQGSAKTTSTTATTATTAVQPDSAPSGAPGGATPADAVHKYLNALAVRDGPTACGMLSTHAQAEAIHLVQRPGKPALKNCGAALLISIANVRAKDLKTIRNVPIAKSAINGDTATLRPKGATRDVGLTRFDGRWYITSPRA